MIVEDEALALALEDILVEIGCRVAGSTNTVAGAHRYDFSVLIGHDRDKGLGSICSFADDAVEDHLGVPMGWRGLLAQVESGDQHTQARPRNLAANHRSR